MLAVVGLCACPKAFAVTEYDLKATFLASVLQFVKWPAASFPDAGAPFELGILGTDPFGAAVEAAVRGLVISGHSVVVKRARAAGALAGCEAVFICPSEAGRLASILGAFEGSSTLTVSDISKSAQGGVMVELPLDGAKVVIEINAAEAAQARLKLSSKLLKLARKIY